MKVGVFLILFQNKLLEEALDLVEELGVEAVEIGCGNYPGDAHCKPDELLKNEGKRKKWLKLFERRGLLISALSCHGNPLHPDPGISKAHQEAQRKTILLAEKIGVERVITFSGCPGGSPGDRTPNWITCAWPEDFSRNLKWQWEEVVFPYWEKEARFAQDHGVKICLEMHPGFVVYNPETLLKLRKEIGENIGANFDPSHLFWQGIDPLRAVRELKESIFHVHAKDTKIDRLNTELNGVLETKPYTRERERSWIFRTVGYGHGESFWKDLVSELRMAGYDWVLSIEHEDSLMSGMEGLIKAVRFLKEIIIKEKIEEVWWA